MVSLGADIYSTLIGRVVFAIGATAALALVLASISDRAFFARLFKASLKERETKQNSHIYRPQKIQFVEILCIVLNIGAILSFAR